MNLNSLDIVIIIIIIVATAYGVWKGFVRQIFSIAGIVGGYFLALNFYRDLASHLTFMDPAAAKILSFVGIFILTLLAAILVGLLVEKVFRLPGLGFINRLGGAGIGFVKGFLIVALIVIVLLTVLPSKEPLLSRSATLPYVLAGIRMLDDVIPQDLKNQYHRKVDELKGRIFKEATKGK